MPEAVNQPQVMEGPAGVLRCPAPGTLVQRRTCCHPGRTTPPPGPQGGGGGPPGRPAPAATRHSRQRPTNRVRASPGRWIGPGGPGPAGPTGRRSSPRTGRNRSRRGQPNHAGGGPPRQDSPGPSSARPRRGRVGQEPPHGGGPGPAKGGGVCQTTLPKVAERVVDQGGAEVGEGGEIAGSGQRQLRKPVEPPGVALRQPGGSFRMKLRRLIPGAGPAGWRGPGQPRPQPSGTCSRQSHQPSCRLTLDPAPGEAQKPPRRDRPVFGDSYVDAAGAAGIRQP